MAKRQPPQPLSDPARAPEPPPLWQRVRTIRRRLEERTWSADQAAELAAAWGITEAMVRGHAAEAARQLEAVLDSKRGEATIAADLDAAIEMAFEQGDPHAIRGLLAEKLKLHGIGAHRDSRNDPKPAAAPAPPEEVPFWLKKKGPKEASS